jgi:membrane associated rhomboid family serine protease
MSIIRCGFTGFLIAGILPFLALLAVGIFMPHDSDERKAWTEFALIMVALSCAVGGLVVGCIYGAIRAVVRAGQAGEQRERPGTVRNLMPQSGQDELRLLEPGFLAFG